MATENFKHIEAVEGVLDKAKTEKQPEKEAFDPSKAENFDKAMGKANTVPQTVEAQPLGDITNRNPMQTAADQYQQNSVKTPSFAHIEETTNRINGRIEQIKEVLNDPDTTVKQSYQGLLEDKLVHIDDALKIALDKAGLEYVPDGATEGIPNAISKFLGFLTRSQKQLNSLGTEVANLRKGTNNEIHPADLLAVQIKVNFVQQEMELFTNLLNKGLESTKTLLNVQV